MANCNNGVLSISQFTMLVDVLDCIIPPEADCLGTGETCVAQHIDCVLRNSPELRAPFLAGLSAIEAASIRGNSRDFSSLSTVEKVDVLRNVESTNPDFFMMLVRQTYVAYYTNNDVVRHLGLEPVPPQPIGYHLDPFDQGSLKQVSRLDKLYKDI